MKVSFLLLCVGYASAAQTHMCVLCSPGKYQTRTSNLPCTDCAFNTYSPSYGMTACASCEQNSISAPGSSSCECLLNYVRADNSSACTFGCADWRVQVGYTCECRAGSYGTDRGACTLCPVHTYASQVGSRVCTACPAQMRSAAGSVSEDACTCGVGFVREGNACTELLPLSVVAQVDLVLQQPSNATFADVRQAILETVSMSYNISAKFIVVDIVLLPISSIRRLLQSVLTVQYSVSIRVLFPAGYSQSLVNQTLSTLGTINTLLQAGLQTESSGMQFNVLNTSVVVARSVDGVFNTNSRQVVSCTLVPWQDELGAAQACERKCGVDEFLIAVAYVQGLFVLDCQRKTSTPAPAPPGQVLLPAESSTSIGAIVGGVAGGIVVVAAALICCICRAQNKIAVAQE